MGLQVEKKYPSKKIYKGEKHCAFGGRRYSSNEDEGKWVLQEHF